MAETAACVDIYQDNKTTLQDAFQFGDPTDTSWNLSNKTFSMAVKASRDDTASLITLTSAGGTIVVDDAVQRVLHLELQPGPLQAALAVGEYVYDLVMSDTITSDKTLLVQGLLIITQGVT